MSDDLVDKQNNSTMKEGTSPSAPPTSPPPPYTQAPEVPAKTLQQEVDEIDEFGEIAPPKQSNPPKSLTKPANSEAQNSVLTPPSTPQNEEFYPGQGGVGGKMEDFQTDIFKRPPKFLLYPSMDGEGAPVVQDKFQGTSPQCPHPGAVGVVAAPVVGGTPKGVVPEVFAVSNGDSESFNQQAPPPVPPEGRWARFSQRVLCPHCNVIVKTETEFVNGAVTHLACFGLFLVTLCCCCVPYFLDELKDVEHYCPNCNNVIGMNQKKIF